MMTSDKELSVLEKHEVRTDWKANAQWRRENRQWLRYSGLIALKALRRLEETGMSQKQLAERMNCSPQYVSRLLKGSENMTLDTISRLEVALEMSLFKEIVP